MFTALLLIVLVAAAFIVGVMTGPTIHAMIKTCQDDVVNSGEGSGGLGSCFPNTKQEPSIAPGDYWQDCKADGKPKRKRSKGKRKGK